MAENEVVRTIRVRGVPEGLENLTSQLQRAEQAYSGVGAAASTAGTATETSARKLNVTERAYRTLTERLDSTARVYRQLQVDTRTLSGAFDAGFMGKGAEAAAKFNAQLSLLRQNLQDAGGRVATGSSGLDRLLDVDRVAKSARDAAVVFEAELMRLDTIAQQRAAQIGADFGRELSERLVASTGKSARDSASIFEAEMGRLDDIARQKGAQAGQEFQRALNERLVSGRLAGPDFARQLQQQIQEQGAAQEKQAQSIQKLRQQYDPLGVAQERYAAAIAETNGLLQAGKIDEAQHVTITTNAKKVLDDTTNAYNGAFVAQGKYTSGAGLARHELINLSRQIQDVGVSLASGQSPFTVLIQQGTQIADVFAASRASVAGFFAQAARGVAGFAMSGAGLATGGALLGAGAAIAGYQYAESQREIERALSGVGRQSGITTALINRMSDAYADAARVSTATAREMLASFAGTGKVGAALLPQTANLSKDFAAQFSLSATDAAKQLAGAFVDPTMGAQELNKQLGFLDARTLEYIRTAQAQSRLGDAQKAMADALAQSVQGAADRTSGLAKAWNAVWNAASGAWDAVGKAIAGQITLEERLARAIERRGKSGLSSGYGARFSRGFDAAADAEIADVQEQIRRRNQQADLDARTARENSASTGALSVIDELNPFGAELRRLETMASALKKGLEEAGRALSPEQAQQVREAYERVTAAIQAALTPIERQRQTNALTVAAISARTLAERTSVEVARLQLDSAFRLKETEEQRLIILGKINEMQAQANREARDALRSARDQSELAGLRPYQRRLREIEFRERDNRERFGGVVATTALPASTSAATGLDNAFAASLKQMAAAIPGITVTSGFRSYEQQAKLYAEKPHLAAPPGRSQHEKGRAADLAFANADVRAEAHRRAGEFGLTFPLKDRSRNPEPWHVEPVGGRGRTGGTSSAAASSIAELERSTATTEAYNSIIRNANDNLAAQQAQLRAQRDTLFMSNEEVAKAQKFQELYNQAVQEGGVALAERLRPAIEQTAAGYGALARQTEELQRAQDAMKTIGDLGRSLIGGMISDFRNGATGADMFRNALDKIASKLLDMALNDLFGKAFGNNGAGLFGGGGFLSSLLGGFGGGGIVPGTGGLIARGSGGGYASGGYTGAGGKYDVAGLVHRDEFVFSKEATRRIGAGNLDAMHRGALRGYDSGGYVSPTPYVHPPANSNSVSKVNVQVVNRTTGEVEGSATTRQNPDGSLDVMVDLIEARLAGRMVHGQGDLNRAMRAVGTNRQLRG